MRVGERSELREGGREGGKGEQGQGIGKSRWCWKQKQREKCVKVYVQRVSVKGRKDMLEVEKAEKKNNGKEKERRTKEWKCK